MGSAIHVQGEAVLVVGMNRSLPGCPRALGLRLCCLPSDLLWLSGWLVVGSPPIPPQGPGSASPAGFPWLEDVCGLPGPALPTCMAARDTGESRALAALSDWLELVDKYPSSLAYPPGMTPRRHVFCAVCRVSCGTQLHCPQG